MVAAFILMSFLVIAFPTFYFAIWKVPSYEAEIRMLKSRENKELREALKIPPAKNAWTYYKKAAASFASPDLKNDAARRIFERGFVRPSRILLTEYESAWQKEIQIAHQGFQNADRCDCAMDRFVNNRSLDHRTISAFADMLAGLAYMKEMDGKYAEAIRLYLEVEQIRMACVDMNSQFLAGENDPNILPSLRDAINNSIESVDFYKRIVGKMQEMQRDFPTYGEMVENKILWSERRFDEIDRNGIKDHVIYDLPNPIKVEYLPQKSIAYRERCIIRHRLLAKIPPPNCRFKEFNRKLWDMDCARLPPLTLIIADYWTYSHKLYNQMEFSRVGFNGILILAALKWYKAENGRFPDRLEQLVPRYLSALPEDPFSEDGRFYYEKLPAGILFISTGPDQTNDMGFQEAKNTENRGDIIFMLPEKRRFRY